MDIPTAAYALGQDCARFRLRRASYAPEAFLTGYDAYSDTKSNADTFTKKWLGLRLSAIKRGLILDAAVTPTAIREMTGRRCPVSLQPFDLKKAGSPSNPSVDRIINEGTYALGNLLVVTQRVNRAKGSLSFEQVAEIAQAGEDAEGVRAIEWARLCSLMYGPWNSYNGGRDPYIVPMATYPPPHAFSPTSQAVQLLLLKSFEKVSSEGVAFEPWMGMTAEACGSRAPFEVVRDALVVAARRENYLPSLWLREEVFTPFADWYTACRATVDAVVEAALARHQPEFDLGAMLEAWRVAQRVTPQPPQTLSTPSA